MIKITNEQQFNTTLWKNGKGKTTELAISDNSSLENFSWRLSIASVSENGLFSNFSGLYRHLILLTGIGIELFHQSPTTKKNTEDRLDKPLSIAKFDGADQTTGQLLSGPITDFNVMHNPISHSASVATFVEPETVCLKKSELCFAFSLAHAMTLTDKDKNITHVNANHLLSLNDIEDNIFTISGEQMIIIYLNRKTL